ncbi:serine/threonine-protein kinase [uncultured Thiodictyon sp.]|uniref:serine/threonine-protein kinase n=1 Tax=uncultured Thiodictyon sp. TaxID=1846217 RepID=UPI0025CF45C2|nr:serine/threonine-protein kinase [uncultured Thiodictyon sp.]
MNDEANKVVDGRASHATNILSPSDSPWLERHPEPSVTGSEASAGVVSPNSTADLASPFGIPPGTVLVNTYRVERQLGGGGMGEVYLTRHAKLGTLHAVKVIRPFMVANRQAMDLFYREARVLRGVRHDAVVSYDGFVQDHDGRDYLIMEYADGPSLAERIHQGPLSVDEVLTLRDRLAGGLAQAHRQGAVHRDLAPDNVILPGGQVAAAKLIDFGLSKLTQPGTQSIIGSSFAGKHLFASPEQFGMFGGKVDARSDIYSLGLVLAAAALGRPLKMGTTLEAAVLTRQGEPDLSRVPSVLRPWLAAMLAPDPARRPASLDDLLLRWPVAGGAVAGQGAVTRGRIGLIGGALFLVAVAVGFAGWLLLPKNPQDADDSAYKTALGAGSEAGYHAYLANCAVNGCGHRVEAQQRLNALVAEREARERAEHERLARVAAHLKFEQERQVADERQAADERAFEAARKADTEQGYRIYLGACAANGCGYQGEALKRLTALVTAPEARERAERERAEREPIVQPETTAKAAADRQDADERAFKTAETANREAAYQTYLDDCAPNGCGYRAEVEQALAVVREAGQKKLKLQLAAAQGLLEKRNIAAALRALDDAKTWDRDGAVAAFRRERTVKLHAAARAFLEQGRADKAKLVLDDMRQWDPLAPEVAELRERLAGQRN